MEWFNLRLNGMVYHVIFIPLLNRLVDIDYPYISDYPSYCIVNLGALAQGHRGHDQDVLLEVIDVL